MYQVRVKNGMDAEEVLEKALESIRAEEKEEITDPFLLYLADYLFDLYDKIAESMVEDILEVLYERKPKKVLLRKQ